MDVVLAKEQGFVSLVGAGPGDPDLITVAGLRRLRQADVIVYDRLANETLLTEARADATRIYAGKGPDSHVLSQDEINALLVEHGRAGKRVVRLKGGDPFVFGRGGEEAEALVASNIRFEVIPGITSAIAAPAYAGIPVTHRDYTTAFTVVTGHEDPGKVESTIPWDALAAGPDTLIFLMGVGRLDLITAKLMQAGRRPDTPVAVVRRGTWPDQQLVRGTLANIAKRVEEVSLTAPAVTIVGRVTELAASLSWFRPAGLAGKRVLVTRAREQASGLSALLSSYGAMVCEYPAIHIEPAEDYRALDDALLAIEQYDWICFTSVNAVSHVAARMRRIGRPMHLPASTRVAAIGPATARALEELPMEVAYMPERFLASAIAEGLPDARGSRILLARADIVDERLVVALQARGATVDQFVAYRTVVANDDTTMLLARLRDRELDIVTFASSSTVTNLCAALGDEAAALLGHTVLACIGPITAQTVREHGLEPAVVAAEHTIPGLVSAIREYLT